MKTTVRQPNYVRLKASAVMPDDKWKAIVNTWMKKATTKLNKYASSDVYDSDDYLIIYEGAVCHVWTALPQVGNVLKGLCPDGHAHCCKWTQDPNGDVAMLQHKKDGVRTIHGKVEILKGLGIDPWPVYIKARLEVGDELSEYLNHPETDYATLKAHYDESIPTEIELRKAFYPFANHSTIGVLIDEKSKDVFVRFIPTHEYSRADAVADAVFAVKFVPALGELEFFYASERDRVTFTVNKIKPLESGVSYEPVDRPQDLVGLPVHVFASRYH